MNQDPSIIDALVPYAYLCRVRPYKVFWFVEVTNGVHFSQLSNAKRRMLARIAKCRFSTGLFLEFTAAKDGKRLEYVVDGIPVERPPVE